MDTERLGRVLGVGARHAAKTFVGAVEAASAPAPAARQRSPASVASTAEGVAPVTSTSAPVAPVQRVMQSVAPGERTVAAGTAHPAGRASGGTASTSPAGARAADTRRGVVEGGRRFGRAVWEPAVRLSGVLWLEVTGLFFGIFFFVAATAAWRLRGAVHVTAGGTNAQMHSQFLLAIGMLLVFGYFCGSSFLAAKRRSRRR